MSLFEELYQDTNRSDAKRMHSIITGTVVENWDEKHPGMVRVELFLGESGKNETDWVRVAQPYAGKGFGSYFLPEVGDEVVLAFHLGDPDHPVVIGSLWNQVDTLPEDTAREKNDIKRIKTKGGHELIFGEEEGKETITLHTPGKLKLLLEDETMTITIQDSEGKNLLSVDGKNGIVTVTAEKKMVLDVGCGGLTLDGQGKKALLKMDSISIEAGQNLTLKGQNVKIEGSMMKVESSGNLDAKAGGMLVLKGAMAKIN